MVDSFGADEAFLKHSKMLRAYVRRLVNDSNDVAEIMQEVGLRILELRDRQIEWDESGGWCRALARNVVAHFHRSRRRRNVLHVSFDEEVAPADSPEHTPEDTVVVRNLLKGALGDLDATSLRLLVRRYLLEESAEEIARDTDRSPDSVRMRLMRLRGAARARKS